MDPIRLSEGHVLWGALGVYKFRFCIQIIRYKVLICNFDWKIRLDIAEINRGGNYNSAAAN